jgi:hypothetical protein
MTSLPKVTIPAAFRRIPVTTVRLEVEGDVREGNLAIVAVPSYRRIAVFGADYAAAAEALDALNERLEAQRRSIARPDGTCPRCASPLRRRSIYTLDEEATFLGYEFWCPACEAVVAPVGASAEEDRSRAGYRADARRRIEASRG